MFHQRVVCVAAVVLLSAAFCNGHICYTCQISGGDKDKSCLENPSSSRTTDCTNARYCQTQLQFYAEGGALYTFARFCSGNDGSKPVYTNATVKEDHFVTHYTACNWDKCNNGDGVWRASSGKPPSFGVPGKGWGGGGAGAVTPLAWMTALMAALAVATAARRLN